MKDEKKNNEKKNNEKKKDEKAMETIIEGIYKALGISHPTTYEPIFKPHTGSNVIPVVRMHEDLDILNERPDFNIMNLKTMTETAYTLDNIHITTNIQISNVLNIGNIKLK